MDDKTRELRDAHDVLAELYVERLADFLEHMPIEQALLGLFCQEMVRVARRNHPEHPFAVAGLRALPFSSGSMASIRRTGPSPSVNSPGW